MRIEDCFYLGNFVGKYSFKGELLLKLDSNDPTIIKKLDTLFIDSGMGLVPYFIEKIKLHKSHLLRLKLEGINTEQGADALLKKSVYLPLKLLPPLTGNTFYYHEIIGFKVMSQKNLLGTIIGFQDNGNQDLLVVQKPTNKEILIPVHDDFILKLDRKHKELNVQLPDGFLELF